MEEKCGRLVQEWGDLVEKCQNGGVGTRGEKEKRHKGNGEMKHQLSLKNALAKFRPVMINLDRSNAIQNTRQNEASTGHDETRPVMIKLDRSKNITTGRMNSSG